jgi:glycolate oxidase iron-sulfur subunit
MFKLLGLANRLFYDRIPVEGWLRELLPFARNGAKKSVPGFGKRNLKNEVPEIVRVKNPKMRVVFFSGCMTDYVYQDAGHNIIDLLKSNNIETIIPKNISCCGAPAYYMGDQKTALKLAQKNFSLLSKLNPDYIITNCATCGNALKSLYKSLLHLKGHDLNFTDKVMDFHKFYTTHIGIPPGKKNFSSKKNIKITYHDPCHLKRGQKVYSEPRELLKSLPGVEFVEMDSPDACCGGAGGFNIKHYDLSLDIGKRKAESIKRTGADIVATGCPSCQMQLKDILNRADYNRPVCHVADLLKDPSNLTHND